MKALLIISGKLDLVLELQKYVKLVTLQLVVSSMHASKTHEVVPMDVDSSN
jgi:hypothetical protein